MAEQADPIKEEICMSLRLKGDPLRPAINSSRLSASSCISDEVPNRHQSFDCGNCGFQHGKAVMYLRTRGDRVSIRGPGAFGRVHFWDPIVFQGDD
jgi:hypothetical protein